MDCKIKKMAARNLKLGDGCFWIHPECNDYKGIWTSISKDWLDVKSALFGKFSGDVALRRKANAKGCFKNAKPLYALATFVDPVFSDYARFDKSVVIEELTLEDLALWYLDDGCLIRRKDSGSYRYVLCVGDVLGYEEILLNRIKSLTGLRKVGRIYKNNSRASEKNKSYYMPIAVGEIITSVARGFTPPSLLRKLPDEGSTTSRKT